MPRIAKSKDRPLSAEPPALTAEDREDQLIALAVDLAEQRLRDGTASNQLVAEIMKRGSMRERLEREKLKNENEMLRAKREAMEAQKRTDEMYDRAIEAMRTYMGIAEDYDGDPYILGVD